MEDYQYMTIGQVALYLNINKITIRKYMKEKGLPYYQVEKAGSLRFDKNQIDSWYVKFRKGKF